MTTSASPLLKEIRFHCEAGSTGLLGLTGQSGERVEVCFREGLIDAVSVAGSKSGSYLGARRLGHYLVEDAGVPVQTLVSLQSESRRKKVAIGEAALGRGLVNEAELQVLVRRQAFELIHHVLLDLAPSSAFARVAHRPYRIPAAMRFEHLHLELARNDPELYRTDGNHWFALRDGADLSAYPWLPTELSVLSELARPRNFDSLRSVVDLDEVSLRRVLGALFRVDVLETLHISPDSAAGESGDALARSKGIDLERLIPVTSSALVNERLEVVRSGSSFTSEQFKNLKVQIGEISGPGHKVYAVSSPAAGDGKSLVSLGLAFSCALDPNRRVLVVDCDLRNPAVDRYLGVPSGPGLMQYIGNGSVGPECYLRRIENLYFMAAGGTASNPVEVLSMEKMRNLIRSLQKEFDTIILDAPPYSPIVDARIVTALSDGLILVVRRGKTSYSLTERAFKAVDPNKLMGVVFNDVKPMLFHTYESYPYYGNGRDRYLRPERRTLNATKPHKTYLDS